MGNQKRSLRKGDSNHDAGALYLFLKYFNEIDYFKYEPDDVNQDVEIYYQGKMWAVNIKSLTKQSPTIDEATEKINEALADIAKHPKDYDKADKVSILVNNPVNIEGVILTSGKTRVFDGNEVEVFHSDVNDIILYIYSRYSVQTSQRIVLERLFLTLLDFIKSIAVASTEILFSKDMFDEAVKIITFNEVLSSNELTSEIELKQSVSKKFSDNKFREDYFSDFNKQYNNYITGSVQKNKLEFKIADSYDENEYMADLVELMAKYNREIEGWNEN